MAIAHACIQCGNDLARTRALVDSVYHLPLCQCPCCHTWCVRRKHPILRRWQQTRHAINLFFSILFRTSALLIVVMSLHSINPHLITEFGNSRDAIIQALQSSSQLWLQNLLIDHIAPFIAWFLICVLAGSMVSGVMAHWKRGLAWITWLSLLIFMGSYSIVLSSLYHTIVWVAPSFGGWQARYDFVSFTPATLLGPWLMTMGGVAISFVASLAGAPLGWLFVKASRNGRLARFRKRRYQKRVAQRR